MNKSFYYPIRWSEQKRVKQVLCSINVPFTFQTLNGECIVVFSNLPAMKYSQVRNVFGYDGLTYTAL
jgi:hypothetical protein